MQLKLVSENVGFLLYCVYWRIFFEVLMEYEFINDTITGIAKAKFSFEHQVIGPWLEVEVGVNPEKLTAVLYAMSQIESGQQREISMIGSEYSLLMNVDDVEIHANALLNGTEELPEALSGDDMDFDLSASSCCGMEDFREFLLSWARFSNIN